jgi:excisionase family DNA binding protein
MPPANATAGVTIRDLDARRLAAGLTTGRGWTPRELARVLRVSPDRVRAWIKSGELGAIDTARHRCGKPRYVILPHHLAEFERGRAAAAPAKPQRRRRRQPAGYIDFFPNE